MFYAAWCISIASPRHTPVHPFTGPPPPRQPPSVSQEKVWAPTPVTLPEKAIPQTRPPELPRTAGAATSRPGLCRRRSGRPGSASAMMLRASSSADDGQAGGLDAGDETAITSSADGRPGGERPSSTARSHHSPPSAKAPTAPVKTGEEELDYGQDDYENAHDRLRPLEAFRRGLTGNRADTLA